jgi:hypothetical protein
MPRQRPCRGAAAAFALAGANVRRSGENDDGILTAAKAAQLDLRRTQLEQGDGVYGLRRAPVFTDAEVQHVSLWKPADAQT